MYNHKILGVTCPKRLFVVVAVPIGPIRLGTWHHLMFVVPEVIGTVRALALVGALCAAPVSPALAPESARAASSRAAAHEIAQKIRVRGVSNFGKVTPTLFRGAQPTSEGLKTLAQMGVQIVVDLREGQQPTRENKEVTALGMRFVGIPWSCTSPKDDYFAKFLALVRDNPDKKIFVHCHMGVDRTGMMIASYRMAGQGWTAGEALREMRAFGFSPFHEMMCYGLASYEQRFPAVASSSPAFAAQRPAEQKPRIPVPPKQ